MNWFQPTSETVAYVSELCLAIVILIYLFSLRPKSRNSYLFIGFMFSFFLFALANIFITASFPTTNKFLAFSNSITVSIAEYFWLLFAMYFPRNDYPKESVTILLLAIIPTVFPYFPLNPNGILTPGMIAFYSGMFLYIISLYVRKLNRLRRYPRREDTYSLTQIKKEKKFFRTNIFSAGINLTTFTSLFLVSFGIIPLFVWLILIHVLNLSSCTIVNYSVLNYTQQSTSFRAKLTGIILCAVLILLGVLPFLLLGPAWVDQTGNSASDEAGKVIPHNILYHFMMLIPLVTLLIVTLFPLLFKNDVLQPLNRILSSVQQVNDGQLDTHISVEVNDEIGVLSGNFNRMASSLQRYADKMNELVEERTAALNKSLEELKSTQAQLIQSEKMASLGELTAGIAHEIQNPLNFVNNFSEVNKEMIDEANEEIDKGNMEEVRNILNDIRDNSEKINQHGKRADAIVKGMLQHSRQSKGVKELSDINALCDEYLRLSYHGLRAKDKAFNADFTTDFDESVGKINIVPQDMGRVLLNLFNNAFYAVNEKTKVLGESYKPLVSVQTRKIANKIEIVIGDNGNGIPQNVIDKIFQPFFTTKPTGSGTGLGLSLAYDIVTKEHNGTLRVKSEVGQTTEFVIQLPL